MPGQRVARSGSEEQRTAGPGASRDAAPRAAPGQQRMGWAGLEHSCEAKARTFSAEVDHC